MAVSENIKYGFNQLELGIVAFVSNLEFKLQNILPELPVFILETGDTSYYIKEKFVETDNKEIYQKTPRFVMTVEDVQYQPDNNSNAYNKATYLFQEKNYICNCRRVTILIPIDTSFVSPNFILALQNFEILSTIMTRENVFTYEFLGNTYSGAYTLAPPITTKPGLDISAGSRNAVVKTAIELYLNILVPRIESIKLVSDIGFETTDFGIASDGEKNKMINNE